MNAKKNPNSLTPKQLQFVGEYLIDLNSTAACIRAGYSARNANKIGPSLLKKPVVAAAIKAGLAKRSRKTKVSQQWVIRKLVRLVNKLGKESSPAARVRALELLGKHLGMFAEHHYHKHGGDDKAPPIRAKVDWTKVPIDLRRQLLTHLQQGSSNGNGVAGTAARSN